ncbi:hypothetical protein VCHA53O473_40288 [Vibrio chagasii]|nr:hypothetical protein VCHA53O473_40288 [Vibrio chagasii]
MKLLFHRWLALLIKRFLILQISLINPYMVSVIGSFLKLHLTSRHYKFNKAFKSDSQRMVFFIPLLGFVFTVVWLGVVVALLTYMVSPSFASLQYD